MNTLEILGVLENKGAVLRGHFRLSSGRHSDTFVQKFRVFEHPRLTQSLGDEIARQWAAKFDVVACPAVGAIVLGYATAHAAGARMVFAEREGDSLVFRRGFELAPHERTLVVEDVITTGGSAREVVDLVKASGAEAVGIGALLDRGDPARPPDLGAPLRSLIHLEVRSWDPAECPLCASGTALDDPGSRRL